MESRQQITELKLEKQIARLRRRTDQLNLISAKYWTARRIIFVSGALLALAFCNFAGTKSAWFVAALLVIVFSIVTIFHTRTRDSLTRNSLLIEIKQVQIARIRLQWERLPEADQTQLPDANHPFESDLDITGERSLHRLIDCAVTREGSERLRSWLLSARPDAKLIEHRQKLVGELKSHSLFRDKLQLLSAVAQIGSAGPAQSTRGSHRWNSKVLVDWIERSGPRSPLLPTVVLLSVLSAMNIAAVVLWSFDLIPRVWPLIFVVYVGTMLLRQSLIAGAWGELHDLEKALTHFRVVFNYLESRSYQHMPKVAEICAPFAEKGRRPSIEMKRLGRLAAALGIRTNPLLYLLIHILVPWDFIFTYRLELVKKEIVHLLPRWLDAWHELEALNSLANFAHLNQSYVFPQLIADTDRFAASNLGHPLLKPESKVCNDFALDHEHRIVILTGSNMAGKSTFSAPSA
jgi:hypothetical protein